MDSAPQARHTVGPPHMLTLALNFSTQHQSDAATLCPNLYRVCQDTWLKNFNLQKVIPKRASYVGKFIFSS